MQAWRRYFPQQFIIILFYTLFPYFFLFERLFQNKLIKEHLSSMSLAF